eukprot:gene24800-biopygen22427
MHVPDTQRRVLAPPSPCTIRTAAAAPCSPRRSALPQPHSLLSAYNYARGCRGGGRTIRLGGAPIPHGSAGEQADPTHTPGNPPPARDPTCVRDGHGPPRASPRKPPANHPPHTQGISLGRGAAGRPASGPFPVAAIRPHRCTYAHNPALGRVSLSSTAPHRKQARPPGKDGSGRGPDRTIKFNEIDAGRTRTGRGRGCFSLPPPHTHTHTAPPPLRGGVPTPTPQRRYRPRRRAEVVIQGVFFNYWSGGGGQCPHAGCECPAWYTSSVRQRGKARTRPRAGLCAYVHLCGRMAATGNGPDAGRPAAPRPREIPWGLAPGAGSPGCALGPPVPQRCREGSARHQGEWCVRRRDNRVRNCRQRAANGVAEGRSGAGYTGRPPPCVWCTD